MIYFKDIRISVFSDTLFRVEYQPQRIFEDRPTLLMGKQMPQEISVKTEKKGNYIVVRTDKCELLYHQSGDGFDKDRLEVSFYRGRKKTTWDRSLEHDSPAPQVHRSLDHWTQGVKRYPTPIIINPDGWHCIEDNPGVYWDETTRWPVVKRHPHYENLYLFFYGDDIKQAFCDFIYLFGRPALIPRQAFGAWYSRWYDYKADELEKLVCAYQKYKLPLDVLVIDVDWHEHHWNGYDWRKKSFPQPEKFIRTIKKTGHALVLNDHPGYDLSDPLPEDDTRLTGLKKTLKEPPYKGMWACDWSRASVVKKWGQRCLADLLKQGIDWWWIDGWADTPFPGVDSQLWLNWQYYDITQKNMPDKRSLILSRWGGIGSHRYPVQFSGDTHANFETLEFEVDFTAYSGGLGAYYWSHDIGGFHECEVPEELYLRWVQFGALSPIFRTHSNHGIREPFHFSKQAIEIYRNYLNLRYKLLPYIEQLQMRCHLTGFPLVYPMSFSCSGKKWADVSGQYFFGDAFIVAPITRPMRGNTCSRKVKLPKGDWLDLVNGKWYSGNREICPRVSIEHIPIFVRKGAIVPVAPVVSPIPSGPYREITFYFFGFSDSVKQVFYFDDGKTNHSMKEKNIGKIKIGYRNIVGKVNVTCEIENEKFLPEILTFACYVDKFPPIHSRKFPGNIDCNHERLLADFSGKSFKCVRWSVERDELKHRNCWTLKNF